MKKNKILIITNKKDGHVDHVINYCNKKGLSNSIIRLNTEDFIDNVISDFNGIEYNVHILDSDKRFSSSEIKTVWFRRPKDFLIDDNINKDIAKFIKLETNAFLRGLYFCTHDSALWINPLYSLHRSRIKMQQIQLANKLGFNVPKTLATNNKKLALKFINSNKKNIVKTMEVPYFVENGYTKAIFTQLIDSENIDYLDNLSICPTFFQEFIEKKVDLRIVVFGKNIFAFAIHSTENPLSVIDLRGVAPDYLKHELYELPKDILLKIKEFIALQGLNFSSMDFILSRDNKYYFIENNPNGQWLWLELATNYSLTDKFVNYLFNHI